jgi:hypothetical protein
MIEATDLCNLIDAAAVVRFREIRAVRADERGRAGLRVGGELNDDCLGWFFAFEPTRMPTEKSASERPGQGTDERGQPNM